jgi:transcriptional regulator with XRE-family HTH domain
MNDQTRLRLQRLRTGMTQAQLAEKMGMNPTTISQAERGIASFEVKFKLAQAFGVPMDRFLEFADYVDVPDDSPSVIPPVPDLRLLIRAKDETDTERREEMKNRR